MHPCIGIGRTVRSDQQIRTVKIGGIHRDQLDLTGPLAQLGHRRFVRGGLLLFRHKLPQPLPGASAGLFRLLVGLHRLFIIGGSLPLHKGNGSGGTCRKAVAQAITVIVPHQLGLTVYHADGALMAGRSTGAAAIALFCINMNDPTNHSSCSFQAA